MARRVRKICSEDTSFESARTKFSGLLKERGYSDSSISEAFEKFASIDRVELFTLNESSNTHKRCFPLVTEFNPHLPKVTPVLQRHKHILTLDPTVNEAIPQDSIFASFGQPKNIKELLVHSKFISTRENTSADFSCKGCKNKCYLCKHFLVECRSFKSFECATEFKIKQVLDCNTQGVIYLLLDDICKRSYIGSTIDSMKTRMSNYKSHLKTNHSGCEMAQHFDETCDLHSLYKVDGASSSRSKLSQDNFDSHLGNQIKVIIIEKVDLSLAESTKEKRNLIEIREGFWQTQLRTLVRYGGLNKKDERAISNKRKATLPSTTLENFSGNQKSTNTKPKPKPKLITKNTATAKPCPTMTQSPNMLPPNIRRSSRLQNVPREPP